jgi:hypothetical protein
MTIRWISSLRRAQGYALVIAAMSLVSLAFAAPALAKEPTGDFARFKQCPRFTPGVNFCIFGEIKSGEVTVGNSTVPIKNAITLQGGSDRNEEAEPVTETFVGAINGDTLSKTPQPVPGGLASLVNCNEISNLLLKASCKLVFENGLTGVNAITELARPASSIGISTDNLTNIEGVALSLPVKVRLENPLLGGECYIGSSANPVTFDLTDGTTSPPPPNEPIKGKLGNLEFIDEFTIAEITENTLVDNAFSAPSVTGCGGLLSFALDPIINAKLGLPSAAGHNTAIQNGSQWQATAEVVRNHEE